MIKSKHKTSLQILPSLVATVMFPSFLIPHFLANNLNIAILHLYKVLSLFQHTHTILPQTFEYHLLNMALQNHIDLAIMLPHFSATCLVRCYLYLSCPDGYIHHFKGCDTLASNTMPHDICYLCKNKKMVPSHPNIILWT
jgi:hypothetical protein